MSTHSKAAALGAMLAQDLNTRLPALGATLSYDTDGSTLIRVGTSGAGNDGGLIRVTAASVPWKDIFGNAQTVFSPTVIQIATEANYAGATDNIADAVTAATLLAMLGECLSKGARTEWYQSATGVAPSTSTFAAGNLKGSYESLQYPLVSNS